MSNDILFEIGTEELPSRAVQLLAEALQQHVLATLDAAGISHGEARSFATPRRLAVLVSTVARQQRDQVISRRGPAVVDIQEIQHNPSAALLGFAKTCGVALDQLTTITTDKGRWWCYEAVKPGESTQTLLPKLLQEAVARLPIAKGMCWGHGDVLFARPVHWVVLLYGTELVEATILGVPSGRYSYGHRFHSPQAIAITEPAAYESSLLQSYVIADFAKRRQRIAAQITALAAQQARQVIMPEALLDEVTSIVEWPKALLAHFDEPFLDIPQEVLIAAMQSHQKCFALCADDGSLVNDFITVSNIESLDEARVIAGNEKVMRARLSDAQFFYQQDRKQQFSANLEQLKRVVFQEKLGTLYDKTIRISSLMQVLTPALALNLTKSLRCADLSKCDLMTGMVGEFPELQGLMGYYYALHAGEDPEIATALHEQYMPRFAADSIPQSSLGLALSLADRIDTLVGTFAIGLKPSGVKDPFKLRRHALAVVRILSTIENHTSLTALISSAAAAFATSANHAIAGLKPFILDRLQSYYLGEGFTADQIQATLLCQDDWLYDFHHRIQALRWFVQQPEASILLQAAKRVNQLLNHGQHDKALSTINPDVLCESAEVALHQLMVTLQQQVQPWYQQQQYTLILQNLLQLAPKIDQFFEHVMVMTDDLALQANRLALLSTLQRLLHGVAHLGLLHTSS